MIGNTFQLGAPESDAIVGRKPHREPPEFDITAMVDLVFMMNIYFMVTFITLALAEIGLPSASHVEPLDADSAVVLTVLGSLDGESVTVTAGSGDEAQPLGEGDEQAEQITAAVEKGAAEGKTSVLIKAEKKVRLRELFRIATAAAAAEGLKLHVAVTERESETSD
jgi:biopolymer transport protein ExbD